MKLAISEDLLIIFRLFLLIIIGEMDEDGCGLNRKNAGNLSKDPRKT
jgi:hypothetical protein